MRYYSDITKKLYDSTDELSKAEEIIKKQKTEEQKKNEERAKKAKEVDEAYKAMIEAQNKYKKVLQEFIDKYKVYHKSITEPIDLFDILNTIF